MVDRAAGVVSEDGRCLSQKSELVSPKRQMSNVLGPCGLWTEDSSQASQGVLQE